MEIQYIIHLVEEYGYIGLFFLLWIGIFGLPIPNEVIVMTVGFASTLDILHPVVTFIVVYSGLLAALTTLYMIGRFLGRPLFHYFQHKKRFSKVLNRSFKLMDRFHAFSLFFGYFIPGIRNFLPFLYGFRKLPFKIFLIFAYTGAFIWLSIVFLVGYIFGDRMEQVIQFGEEILFVLIIVVIIVALFIFYRKKRKAWREQGNPS